MRNIYSAPELKITIFVKEDVITTSGMPETAVQYDETNWGTDGSWMNDFLGN